MPLMGPHFWYDIVRLARRGRSVGIRVVYVIALLVGLGYFYWGNFGHRDFMSLLFDAGRGISINDFSRLGQGYVSTILTLQNLAVLILTPAYLAGAITEERERRTLEMLFTSHLTRWEILSGKLFGRIAHLGSILLAGLPVMALAQLMGGVDMRTLLVNFFNTFLNLLTVGSLCLAVSVHSKTVFQSVTICYGILLPFFGCAGCIAYEAHGSVLQVWPTADEIPRTIMALIAFHGVITVINLQIALAGLRNPAIDEVHPRERYDQVWIDRAYGKADDASTIEERILKAADRLQPLPPLDEGPLLWKEMYLGGRTIAASPAFWAPICSFMVPIALVFVVRMLDPHEEGARFSLGMEVLNPIFRLFLMLYGFLLTIGTAYRACSSVARERQQQTLDALLTLPIERDELITAKWWGSLYKGWAWLVYIGVTLLLSMCTGSVNALGAMVFLLTLLIQVCFFASLGLWLSVNSSTVLSANMKLAAGVMAIVVVVVLFILPWRTGTLSMSWLPVMMWDTLLWSNPKAIHWEEWVISTVIYGFLAAFFYVLAARKFKKTS